MAQSYTIDVYDGSHTAATDLQNIENNFAALKSSFSGASAPSNTEFGMPWADTGQKVIKVRNDTDDAWWGYMHGDTSQKIMVYRNAAMDGWAIDSSSATDKAVALKGGSTYTTGGANAGSWTISGLTSANESAHTHTGGAHSHGLTTTGKDDIGSPGSSVYLLTTTSTNSGGGSATTSSGTAHNHSVSQDGTWRISAAVFTLQYLDL